MSVFLVKIILVLYLLIAYCYQLANAIKIQLVENFTKVTKKTKNISIGSFDRFSYRLPPKFSTT